MTKFKSIIRNKIIWFFVLLFAVVFLNNSSLLVNTSTSEDTINTKTWGFINGRTWSALGSATSDGRYFFAGDGMSFYEENNQAYCKVMIYGSGVPLIWEYVSQVKIFEENKIIISLPKNYGPNNKETFDKDNTEETMLELVNNKIFFDGRIYRSNI